VVLREEGVGIAKEQLKGLIRTIMQGKGKIIEHTRSSPVTLLTLPQAFMTKASL
jgi:hypothetical protein